MKIFLEYGISSLDEMQDYYNKYAGGGNIYNQNISVDNNKAYGGNLFEIRSPKKKWKALDNIEYEAIPDTTFTKERTGAGSIEYFPAEHPEGIIYNNGYYKPHPSPGNDVILYNPKENDIQDIRLDALHIMPKDATYDTLNTLYRNAALDSDVSYNAKMKYDEDVKKYGKDNIDSYEQYYNNEADGLLRNMFIEGTPEYIKSKRYYPNKLELRNWNKHLLPYIDNIQNYLETGQRPSNILPEVTVTGKKKKALGGNLFDGTSQPSQQVSNPLKPNVFRRPDGSYFYQENPDAEEINLTPFNTGLSNDPSQWTYTDTAGKMYTPAQPLVNNTGEITQGRENTWDGYFTRPITKYFDELKYRANTDPSSIALQGKYTMPAIAVSALLPVAGEASYPILTNPYVDAAITSAFGAHGLNHAINEGIDGWGDAAMTALEVAPLGRLAKPMWNAVKLTRNFIPTAESNMAGVRYAYNRNPELANIGTLEEYNDYIKTVFPESKVRDINYHMGPKGLQELNPSTGEVWNTNPNARGIYVTPDKSYSQKIRKFTTDRLEKPSAWTYLKRNLTPGGWDKANETFTDIYPVMIDTKNPLYTKGTWTWGIKDNKYQSLMDKHDAIVNSGPKWYQNFNSMPEAIVPRTEQTLILGSDADVAGFRRFMSTPQMKEYVDSPKDITSDVGELIAEGSERSVYSSKTNPNIVYKIEDGNAALENINNIKIRSEITDDIIAPETTIGYYKHKNGKYYRVTQQDKYKSFDPDNYDVDLSPELNQKIINTLEKAGWKVEIVNGAAKTASKNGKVLRNLEHYNWGIDSKGNLKLVDQDVIENSKPLLITSENAASMTPEQWTAAQDAAIAKFEIPSFDLNIDALKAGIERQIVENQWKGLTRGEDDVFNYLGSEKHINRIMESGVPRERATKIAQDMRDNAMATDRAIDYTRGEGAYHNVGEYDNGFFNNHRITLDPKYTVMKGLDEQSTYENVIHELGGHGATLGYRPGNYSNVSRRAAQWYEDAITDWSPYHREVYEHNSSLKPVRKPEYANVKDSHIEYLEEVDEYSARARAANIDKNGNNRSDFSELYKYFTKESVDKLKDGVWGLAPFLGLGAAGTLYGKQE